MNKLGVFALSLALTSCGLFERRERVVGTFVEDGEGQPLVTLPTEVGRGESFEVSVSTLGGDCTEQGDTLVEVQGLGASVTPFDIEVQRMTPCLLYAEELVHTAKLTFAQAGTATITFYGQNSDYSSPEKLTTIVRNVTVR